MNANEVKVGMNVTTSGFAGTIVKVCEWSRHGDEVMVEVRLDRGTCCVSCREVVAV